MSLPMREWPARLGPTVLAGVLDAIVLSFVHANERVALVLLLVVGTLFVAATGVFRIVQLLVPGIFCLGGAFVAIDTLDHAPRALVVPYAFVLFLMAETGYDSVRTRASAHAAQYDHARMLYLGVVSLASLIVAVVVLGATSALALGAVIELIGLGAALGVFGSIGLIATRPRRQPATLPVESGRRPRADRSSRG